MSEGPGRGSGNTSVGSAGVLRDDDQRNYSAKDIRDAQSNQSGNANAYLSESNDKQRSLLNEVKQQDEKDDEPPEVAAGKRDPRAPALMHGNKPSRGAEIDAELQAEDEAILKKKGDAMPGKKF